MLDYDAKHGAYKVQIDGSTVVMMASEKMLALRPEASAAAPPPEPPAEPPAVNERLERERGARAAAEDHRVHGPNPRAREHGDGELGDLRVWRWRRGGGVPSAL